MTFPIFNQEREATIVFIDSTSMKGFKNHPLNHCGSWKFDFGKVKYVNAVLSSSFPDGSNGGNPGGFVIEREHKNIYIYIWLY